MDLRYPIGPYDFQAPVAPEDRPRLIDQMEAAPALLRDAVRGLNDEQLDTPYRPGGWTVRQTVHHVPDSHMNAYVRFRLALTEDEPLIKPYDEAKWAELIDTKMPVAVSLDLLECLHRRWVVLLRGLSDAEFARTYRHPEYGEGVRLDTGLGMYAWHGRHHTAHITGLRQRNGWE